ncbi:gamma-butyrobetaine dioxygenase-like isoform X1 [Ptychodera flava]|uniref:gamma-butyrobetaine dioxygenase-like isoform X1 n=1 Tax=Ptychodera flava TaxID=63121 RepID=UPI00396A4CAC
MLTTASRLAGRSRSLLNLSNSVRCSRNVRPFRRATRWLGTASAESNGDHNNGVQPASGGRAFVSRGVTSQAAPSVSDEAQPAIKGSKICDSSKMVLLDWDDGTVSRYPFVWLRDNCRCPACWHQDAEGRIALIEDLNVDIEPASVTVSDDGAKVDILWPDNHLSPFKASLLKDVTFKDELPKRNIRMWGSELLDEMPTFQFDDVMTKDTNLLHYLEELRDTGITLMKGVPAETGHVAKLAERISHMKLTSYGYTHTVKSKVGTNSLAFTGLKLGLHTDLPHYHYTPSITVFHCVEQSGGTTGGESIFADGFKTAMQLKEEDPEAFKILCDTHCDFIEKGYDMIEYYTKSAWPIFSFDRHGNLAKVHYSNALRDSRLRMPAEKVYPYYKAIKTYDNLIHREENTIIYRLQPGDIAMFDNTRILHARKAFEVTKDAVRHLESTYLDWDGIYSKIRCLRERLGMPFHEY